MKFKRPWRLSDLRRKHPDPALAFEVPLPETFELPLEPDSRVHELQNRLAGLDPAAPMPLELVEELETAWPNLYGPGADPFAEFDNAAILPFLPAKALRTAHEILLPLAAWHLSRARLDVAGRLQRRALATAAALAEKPAA